MIVLKSAREIAIMRRAGHILAGVMERLRGFVKPGMSTRDVDEDVEAYIHREGAAPAFKGYRGFPATLCTSRPRSDAFSRSIASRSSGLRTATVVSTSTMPGICPMPAIRRSA